MYKEEIEKMYDGLKIYQGNVSIETPETLYIKKLQQELNKYKIIVETLKKKIKDDFANQLEPTGKEMLDLIEELEKGSEK